LCGHTANAFTRKGESVYYKCIACRSFYNPESVSFSSVWAVSDRYNKHYAKIVQQFAAAEFPDKPKTYKLRYGQSFAQNDFDQVMAEEGWSFSYDEETTVTAFIRSFSVSVNPTYLLANAKSEYVLIYDFAGEAVIKNSVSALNPEHVGSTKAIMTAPAWEIMAKKNGYRILKYDIVGDHAVIAMKRVGETDG
jgi:hypothetical protein